MKGHKAWEVVTTMLHMTKNENSQFPKRQRRMRHAQRGEALS
jgi:hypothetical protein